MGVYSYTVQDQGLGTSTAKTQLSGAQNGSASAWVLPADCRGILAVAPYVYQVTPTASQTSVSTLKIESDDLGIKDFEVLSTPLGASIATTDYGISEPYRFAKYPLFFPTQGGEQVNFYGIPQTANTAQPFMGAEVWWTDDPSVVARDNPYRARVGGNPGAAGSGTSTGTATGAVSGATITISGSEQRTIRGLYGIITNTAVATVKPIAGYFTFSAPELKFAQTAAFEPSPAVLGTAQSFAHLTRVDEIALAFKGPTTIATSAYLTAAPSTAGNFYNGILYQ